MNKKAIGVFDSGLGGLTAVKRLAELAPGEDIIFFGDSARVPYGTRAPSTITRFALQDISFLLSKKVKMIIAACGTVSSTLPAEYISRLPLPYTGVVTPAAFAAAAATRNRRVGVLGTPATIRSGSFSRALASAGPDIVPVPSACPLFVPLVENGYTARDCGITRQVAEAYLEPLVHAGVDTVILGCTHYPIISGIISDVMGDGVAIIDSGYETAKYALGELEKSGDANGEGGRAEFYISDNPVGFSALAGMFLGRDISRDVHLVSLDDISISPCFEVPR
jgi:glutamate racemase